MEVSLTTSPHQQLDSPHDSLEFDDDPSINVDDPHTLKMEDLHHDSSSPSDDNMMLTPSQTSPPPVIVHSKAAKKRKSWGQELPEPKTTLPPRKRAKTDDEKEQRRIERIKRNRAAAHNSRERKRQEAENLAVLLAKANSKLEAYRRLHGPLPSNIVLPEVTVMNEIESTPAPSLVESQGSMEMATSPASTSNDSSHHVHIKQEPIEYGFPSSTLAPSALESADIKKTVSPSLPSLDQAQHSAEMLSFDLQCQSSPKGPMAIATATGTTASPLSTSQACSTSTWGNNSINNMQAAMWASVLTRLFLILITTQMQNFYKSILLAIWTLSPPRMTRLIQASTIRLTRTSRLRTSSTTQQLALPTRPHSRSTMALAQLKAATGLTTNMRSGSALSALGATQQGLLMAVLRAKAEAKRRSIDGQRYSYMVRDGVHGEQGDEKSTTQ